jgi:gamma-glutamylcyclotransferase (GGCT)/AIG2-like uncharacterized protein YtfP
MQKENTEIQNVITLEKYPMYKSNQYFPYLENNKGIGKYIKGELFEIDDICKADYLKTLDEFEGVPYLYIKGKIIVKNNKNEEIEAYTYFKKNKSSIEILNDKKLMNEWI